ncbi:MAG TPA: hypothetical protein PLV68_04315, partial [Ilumatobacteraceae bacterium]|nr:hypothetical protein [Ilumatobacteraceae bacterium]
MGGGSHRQRQAEFDIGVQHAILAMHRRAVAFENADFDIMKLQAAMSDKGAVAEHLKPYQAVMGAGGYAKAVADFNLLAKGYTDQLSRSGDGEKVREFATASKQIDDNRQGFEAAIDFIDRRLAKTS